MKVHELTVLANRLTAAVLIKAAPGLGDQGIERFTMEIREIILAELIGVPQTPAPEVPQGETALVTFCLDQKTDREGSSWSLRPLMIRRGNQVLQEGHGTEFHDFIRHCSQLRDLDVYNSNPVVFGFPDSRLVVGNTTFECSELMELGEDGRVQATIGLSQTQAEIFRTCVARVITRQG